MRQPRPGECRCCRCRPSGRAFSLYVYAVRQSFEWLFIEEKPRRKGFDFRACFINKRKPEMTRIRPAVKAGLTPSDEATKAYMKHALSTGSENAPKSHPPDRAAGFARHKKTARQDAGPFSFAMAKASLSLRDGWPCGQTGRGCQQNSLCEHILRRQPEWNIRLRRLRRPIRPSASPSRLPVRRAFWPCGRRSSGAWLRAASRLPAVR